MATNRHELDKNQQALLELVRAGLWEREANLAQYGKVDFAAISAMAESQGVIGLIAAGLDHADVKPSKIEVLNIIGNALQIEQRNRAMNVFVAELISKLRDNDIFAVLVKGQGVAQCYEKPLWRPSGDVDLLLSRENYCKAKELLLPLSSGSKGEERYSQHLGMNLGDWYVELHGTLRDGLSSRLDSEIDDVVLGSLFMVNGSFSDGTRVWRNGDTEVHLPAPANDVFLVFAHFVKHFYKEGLGLRQVCDWCRLLWTYKDTIDYAQLEERIRRAGLIDEWKAFAVVSVDFLGMDKNAMPMYSSEECWHRKADRIITYLMRKGGRHDKRDIFEIARIFPRNTLKFAAGILFDVNWLKVKERLFSSK